MKNDSLDYAISLLLYADQVGVWVGNAIVLLLLAVGIGLWVRNARLLVRGRPLLEYRPRAEIVWSPFVLVVTGGWLLLSLFSNMISLLNKLTDSSPAASEVTVETVRSNGLMGVAFLAVFLFLLAEAGRRPLAEFGMTFHNWRRDCLTGVLGFLAAFPLVIAVSLIISQFDPGREPQHSYLRLLQKDGAAETIAWIGVNVLVLAPFLEELLFRVILQGALRTRMSANEAIILSSLIFVLVHPFPDMIALLPLAIVLGYVYDRTHSYLAVAATHATFNGVMLVLSLLS